MELVFVQVVMGGGGNGETLVIMLAMILNHGLNVDLAEVQANALFVMVEENYERIIQKQANRVARLGNCSKEVLCRIEEEDINV